MKWLKPKECGLCKAAHSHLRDGECKIKRLPDYWVQKILRKISGPAQFPAGLYLLFHTDSTRLVIKYSCGTVIGPVTQKIMILVEKHELEYRVQSGERNEFMINLHNDIPKQIQILFPWGAEISILGIGIDDQATLTPIPDKRKTICFGGDSITQGLFASSPTLTYPYLVGQGLNMQSVNHGYSGLSLPDPALAIYIAKEIQWDVLCIALGLNAYLSGAQSAAEFGQLYQVFLEIIRLYKPDQPVFCISPIWQKDSDSDGVLNAKNNNLQDYRQAMKNTILDLQTKDSHLYFINGLLLVDSSEDLAEDGIHPDDSGMKAIAHGILMAFKINGLFPLIDRD